MAPNDFANERIASWASEVEDNESATGQEDPPQFAEAVVSPFAYPSPPFKSKKNKKKKKNKANGNAMQARQDSVKSKPLETDFKALNIGPSSMPGRVPPDDAVNPWQAASTRTVKQAPSLVTPSHCDPPSSSPLPYSSIQGRPTHVASGGQPGTNHPNFFNQMDKLKTKALTDGTQAQTQGLVWGNFPPLSAVKDIKRTSEGNRNILSQLLPSERSAIEASSTKTNASGSQPIPQLVLPVRSDSESVLSEGDFDDDSDWIGNDDQCDSDASVKSLETRKQNKWFHPFFDTLDDLTNDHLMEHDRQWHCPACQGGVGAIEWYRGLQPLLAHAKTHKTKRIGLHREFAKVLEEDLEMRRAGAVSGSETKFGKWKGLQNTDATKNLMIVWPPMVVIQNTQLDRDDQDKWIGMGNKELLDMFRDYVPSKARHAYGPQGHRGMSILIFGNSPTGYYHAERLAKAFKDDGKGREQWDRPSKLIFHPGRDRILYGYMANAEDMEIFNRHSSGKSKLKWELKNYKEAVSEPLTQMDKDSQQLHHYKFKVQRQKEHSKILEKSMSLFTKKLIQREEEVAVIRQLAKDQHEENQREMDDLERAYKDRIVELQRNSLKREREIQEKHEDFQQEHIERCQELEKKLGEEEPKHAKVEEAIARQTEIIESSLRESEDYEHNKRELLKQQHVRKRELMRRHYDEALEFEKGLERERQELLDGFSKHTQNETS